MCPEWILLVSILQYYTRSSMVKTRFRFILQLQYTTNTNNNNNKIKKTKLQNNHLYIFSSGFDSNPFFYL